jgi:hypothetical protein
LCGDTNQIKEKEIYENYCRIVINEMRLVSRATAFQSTYQKPEVRKSVMLCQIIKSGKMLQRKRTSVEDRYFL